MHSIDFVSLQERMHRVGISSSMLIFFLVPEIVLGCLSPSFCLFSVIFYYLNFFSHLSQNNCLKHKIKMIVSLNTRHCDDAIERL